MEENETRAYLKPVTYLEWQRISIFCTERYTHLRTQNEPTNNPVNVTKRYHRCRRRINIFP